MCIDLSASIDVVAATTDCKAAEIMAGGKMININMTDNRALTCVIIDVI